MKRVCLHAVVHMKNWPLTVTPVTLKPLHYSGWKNVTSASSRCSKKTKNICRGNRSRSEPFGIFLVYPVCCFHVVLAPRLFLLHLLGVVLMRVSLVAPMTSCVQVVLRTTLTSWGSVQCEDDAGFSGNTLLIGNRERSGNPLGRNEMKRMCISYF